MHLFKLFSNFGNVQRIKILYKNRQNALVQFEECEYARAAKNELQNVPFFGQRLQLSYSKLGHISNFSDDHLDEVQRTLCRDFVAEGFKAEYRFKHPNSKAF